VRGLSAFSHADAVAALLAGYQTSVMTPGRDDTETRVLKLHQDQRARDERRDASTAAEPEEARTHRRRAEKAAYLRDKLAEAERSEKR
jgi:hypothetical protein